MFGLVLLFILINHLQTRSIFSEAKFFDHLPLICHDCFTSNDIIFTQLNTIPARALAQFQLGSQEMNLIFNGHDQLHFEPYAFQQFIIDKPNQTLTMTFVASNLWLNLTKKMFDGLEIRDYSTLKIRISYFYGCSFDSQSLSGIRMGRSARLIFDLSSLTEIFFQSNLIEQNETISSMEFVIARTDTILFDSHSFSSIRLAQNGILSFQFDLISHIRWKIFSFNKIQLEQNSSIMMNTWYLTQLTIDRFAFQSIEFESLAIWNLTFHTLGSSICLTSNSFDHFHGNEDKTSLFLLSFFTLRGLSILSHAFSNFSSIQLRLTSINAFDDPNPIIDLAPYSFSSSSSVILNFSSVNIVRFQNQSINNDTIVYSNHDDRLLPAVSTSTQSSHTINHLPLMVVMFLVIFLVLFLLIIVLLNGLQRKSSNHDGNSWISLRSHQCDSVICHGDNLSK